jgi:hypothetical protein
MGRSHAPFLSVLLVVFFLAFLVVRLDKTWGRAAELVGGGPR